MKTCNTCNLTKPLTDFAKAKLGKQGVTAICKECANIKAQNKRSEKDHISTVVNANKQLIESANTNIQFNGNFESSVAVKTFLTLEQRLIEIHGNKFDYSLSKYVNTHTQMTVVCNVHGPIEVQPANLLQGQGCNQCGRVSTAAKLSKGTDNFIKEAREVHGPKYDYSKVVYTHNKDKVTIICPEHGPFEQVPKDHLSGKGCNTCGHIQTAAMLTKSHEQFITGITRVHGDRYSYENTIYTKAEDPITILCHEHGPFTQIASKHLSGAGCPDCATTGFDKTKPAILYYLSINNGQAYKIGITNRTIQERFGTDMQYIDVLQKYYFQSGADAARIEREILTKFSEYKYTGINLLKDGNTELFTKNILLNYEIKGDQYE